MYDRVNVESFIAYDTSRIIRLYDKNIRHHICETSLKLENLRIGQIGDGNNQKSYEKTVF